MNERSRLANAYAKVRSGRAFFLFLSLFCAGWIILNLLPWFPHWDDAGFGRLTLILSIEASIACSMLMVQGEEQENRQRKQLEYIEHVLEAIRDALIDSNRRG